MHIVGTKRVELTGLLSLLVALLIKCFFTCSAVRISTSVGNIGWGSSIGTNGFGPPEPLSARLNQADAHCVFSVRCGLRPRGGVAARVAGWGCQCVCIVACGCAFAPRHAAQMGETIRMGVVGWPSRIVWMKPVATANR
jgi:hypothetical protein